jgi:hypothetical protein
MINMPESKACKRSLPSNRVDGARELWKLRDAALSVDLTSQIANNG